MRSRPNWYQIGRKTCYIPKVNTFSEENDMLTGLKISSLSWYFYRPKQNVKRGDHMELNFEGLEKM